MLKANRNQLTDPSVYLFINASGFTDITSKRCHDASKDKAASDWVLFMIGEVVVYKLKLAPAEPEPGPGRTLHIPTFPSSSSPLP